MAVDSDKPNIFNYFNYREYLSALFNYNKAINPIFSHRYIITKAGFKSPNSLKNVINGERNLSGTPVLITMEGTAYSTKVNQDGSYAFSDIPEGECFPVIMDIDSQWTFAHTVAVISSEASVNNEEVSFGSLLIDDFEDSVNTRRVGRFVDNSYIYAMHEDVDSASAAYRIVSGGIGGGNALEGTLIRKGRWALLGFSLGVKPNGDSLWDFSSATGCSFWAKGSGKLNVSFECDTIDKMDEYKHYSADIVLQTDWQHYTLSFDSLKFYKDLNPDPDITWLKSARSIKRIEFNALEKDTAQFWLDDLAIEGVDFSAVY